MFVVPWNTGFIAAKYGMNNADQFVFPCLRFTVTAVALIPIMLLMYVIKRGEAGRVSSMFYLAAPPVVIEAHFLFGETLGLVSIAGMLLCVGGVYFVNRPVTG